MTSCQEFKRSFFFSSEAKREFAPRERVLLCGAAILHRHGINLHRCFAKQHEIFIKRLARQSVSFSPLIHGDNALTPASDLKAKKQDEMFLLSQQVNHINTCNTHMDTSWILHGYFMCVLTSLEVISTHMKETDRMCHCTLSGCVCACVRFLPALALHQEAVAKRRGVLYFVFHFSSALLSLWRNLSFSNNKEHNND